MQPSSTSGGWRPRRCTTVLRARPTSSVTASSLPRSELRSAATLLPPLAARSASRVRQHDGPQQLQHGRRTMAGACQWAEQSIVAAVVLSIHRQGRTDGTCTACKWAAALAAIHAPHRPAVRPDGLWGRERAGAEPALRLFRACLAHVCELMIRPDRHGLCCDRVRASACAASTSVT